MGMLFNIPFHLTDWLESRVEGMDDHSWRRRNDEQNISRDKSRGYNLTQSRWATGHYPSITHSGFTRINRNLFWESAISPTV